MTKMTKLETNAWDAYCEDTQGSMHVADFWHELPESVQKRYLGLVVMMGSEMNPLHDDEWRSLWLNRSFQKRGSGPLDD